MKKGAAEKGKAGQAQPPPNSPPVLGGGVRRGNGWGLINLHIFHAKLKDFVIGLGFECFGAEFVSRPAKAVLPKASGNFGDDSEDVSVSFCQLAVWFGHFRLQAI